ncbi:MAG TPA: prolyl oligopeptidase family serine peptidase [Pedobacter sp.]|uniref:carboxylesterase family protein n=1 Tax=Pedobacter sp. TaxID=1411316 RepID=UPI002BC7288C|nr:prolyl oligopeptidase family serine peptidase [Pedobacter sp.]HMI04662.1 prolyl oligopeptidase family serine peptidase [Pedobacter sp.]
MNSILKTTRFTFHFALVICLLFFNPAIAQSDITGSVKTEIVIKKEMGYALHIPANVKEKKPLIIFLHGSGEKAPDIEKVKIHGPFKYLKTHQIDAYVLAPQCPENEDWDTESLYKLILKIQKDNNIDPNRIYLTGLSLGGWETYSLGIAHPEMFAALVPISGFVDLLNIDYICKIKDIPTKIYHGLLDDAVDISSDIQVYKALKKCNANVELNICNECGHDTWSKVYDYPEIYDWMLKQTKK